MRLDRRAVEAGHGVWWGAFAGDALVGTLGDFRADELARFQAVVTHPAERRRGIAATLLYRAAEAAKGRGGATCSCSRPTQRVRRSGSTNASASRHWSGVWV